MCLGVPGRVLQVDDGRQIAVVEFWGVRKEIRLELCDERVCEGDYVLNHVGFAIRRIPTAEVARTLALYDELLRAAEAHDPMAEEVRSEVRAAATLDETRGARDGTD